MLRSAAGKVMWVGRATVFLVGLAVILAVVFGVASTALGANGAPFLLGKQNFASQVSKLVKRGDGAALSLQVQDGHPPMKVNSSGKVANLNADQLDGKSETDFYAAGSQVSDSDKLDDLDSADFQRANAAAGGDLSGNYPSPQITAGAVGAGELAALPAVRAYISPDQTIPDTSGGLYKALEFLGEDFDQGGEMHSTTTNTSRLSAPRDGIYQIQAQVSWGSSPNGTRGVGILKNTNGNCWTTESGQILTGDAMDAGVGDGYSNYTDVGTLAALEKGDYIEVCVSQDSGGDTHVARGTHATMHFVSPR